MKQIVFVQCAIRFVVGDGSIRNDRGERNGCWKLQTISLLHAGTDEKIALSHV
jgi:hypothetical protein